MRLRTALYPVMGVGLLAAWVGSAAGQGLLIPTEPSLPPLSITSHKVAVEIDNQGATTTVEQVFQNHTDRQLEARFVFPLPKGAALTKFTMLVNGVEKPGEMVEAKQARAIYNSIVQRSQDPGLLEYIGRDLLRANVFPILPGSSQKITVRFGSLLPRERELVSYTYPLKTSDKAGPTVRGNFTLSVKISSKEPLRNVYSPTHSIVVSRPDEHTARVEFEQTAASLDKDFRLFYGVSDKHVGLNLLTWRPDPAKPGYFLMLMSPQSRRQAERIVARDVVFVMDTSGSMAGEKIKQARDALKYCVSKLNDGDRFDIVRFSTEVEPWKGQLVPARQADKAALDYIASLEAEGGTNIDGALQQALSYPRDAARPFVVMFFTDGKPTLGETTDPREIAARLEKRLSHNNADNVRIFTWGVGFDLDIPLLERIATLGHGVSEYVAPSEDIAAKVAGFYDKAAHPVLTDLKLDLVGDKVQILDMFPKRLPDLYAGGQTAVFGRYTGAGDVALRLTGKVNGQAEQFVYEASFPDSSPNHGFIEPLWAQRRIGHLLDTIRLHGESQELVADVIRLSKEYGIQTPYTSWLVLEDGMTVPANGPVPAVAGRPVRGQWAGRQMVEDRLRREAGKAAASAPGAPAPALDPAELRKLDALENTLNQLAEQDRKLRAKTNAVGGAPPAQPAEADASVKARQRAQNQLADDLARGALQKPDGREAQNVARYVNQLRSADNASQLEHAALFKKAADTRFFGYRDLWVDERFDPECVLTAVKFGSDAYFALLDKRPDLAEVFKIGTGLIVVTAPGKALMVSAAGEETLSDAQIDALFQPLARK